MADDSSLVTVRQSVCQVAKFVSVESQIRSPNIIEKLQALVHNIQPQLVTAVANVLCQCASLKFKQHTANIFADIIFACLSLIDDLDQAVRQIAASVDQHFTKKTKRSSHMVKAIVEDLFAGWKSSGSRRPTDTTAFKTRFISYIDAFVKDVVYCN